MVKSLYLIALLAEFAKEVKQMKNDGQLKLDQQQVQGQLFALYFIEVAN
jgi:hypothetical protein